uniref:uncharacterized protein LOC105353299 n=1 Tax=Fragaria vesca subsp. vesca TaxID=101020 RepID=UPI0005CAD910|nr:PREDICTED: uncharacterized protein LOC105353299 [Fragaria vesca subsp. vesca]
MVISGEQEKRRRRCGITELPDCIMESIVSLLPLKDAVNTILASPPHWKTLSHPTILTRRNLELNYFNVFGSKSRGKGPLDGCMQLQQCRQCRDFSRRVSKYLQQYQGIKVDSFRLQCRSPVDVESHVSLDEWIRFAIRKGVEELHLTLLVLPSVFVCPSVYVFPPSLHVASTSNLKHLSLESCKLRHATADFGQLTTLSLREVVFDQSLMPNLFSVCVLLESLTLNRCRIQVGPLVAGLETLHLHITPRSPRSSSIPTYGNLKQLSLDIDVSLMQDIVDVNFVLDLLEAAPYLEELVIILIYGDCSKPNQREIRNHSGFTNDHLRMVKLLGLKGYWYETELAICILEISPKLEMLVIDELRRFYLGDGKFRQRRLENELALVGGAPPAAEGEADENNERDASQEEDEESEPDAPISGIFENSVNA